MVDASVVVPAVVDDGQRGAAFRTRLAGESLAAPELLDLEVVSAVRGLRLRGMLEERRADQALSLLLTSPLRRYGHRRLVPRIWELRGNLTPYDAAYVALAEALGATLLTADRRLASAPGVRCPVEVLA